MPEFLIDFIKRDQGGAAFERDQLAQAARIEAAWARAAAAAAGVGAGAVPGARRTGRSGSAPGPSTGGGSGSGVDVGLFQLQAQAVRFAQQAEKAAERRAQAEEKAARRAAAAEERRVTQGMVGLNQLQAAGARMAQRLEQDAEKSARAATAAEQKELAKRANQYKRLLTDEEIAVKVHNQRIFNENQRRLQEAMDAAGVQFKKAGYNGFEGADKLSNMVLGVGKNFLSTAGSIVTGFVGVNAIISEVGDSFERAARTAQEGVNFTQDYRRALLELAALKGKIGTNQATREELQFRAVTLQDQASAIAFQQSALGAGESFIGAKGKAGISQGEFNKLSKFVGSIQAIEGGDADTYGQLTGMLPGIVGRQINAEEGLGEIYKLHSIFQPGGSSFASGSAQFLKNAPLVMSGLYKPEDMAALQSAFSLTSKEGAGDLTQQFTRATVAAQGRMRGVQVIGESEKQAEYLKRLGANDQMTPIQIGKLIAGDLIAKGDEAARRGETLNEYSYLQHHGYGNQEEINSLMLFKGLIQSGQFEGKFEPLARAAPDPGAAKRWIARMQKADPALQARGTEVAEEMAKVARGAGPNEYYDQLMRRVFAQMAANNEASGTYDEIMTGSGLGAMATAAEVRRRASIFLQIQAQRHGVQGAGEALDGGNMFTRTFEGSEGRARRFFGVAQQVAEAGGETLPSLTILKEAADTNLRAAQKMEDAIKAGMAGGRPVAGNPAPPPLPPAKAPPGGGPAR